MKTHSFAFVLSVIFAFSCTPVKDTETAKADIESMNLLRGDIALCGSQEKFGSVSFGSSCSEKVRDNFNLAVALLHSFEYPEAEKVFASVLEEDPECFMAYWGVAMSNFHPLWAPPTPDELVKGARTITVARSLETPSAREKDYLEAVAVIYDDWEKTDHRSRVQKFEIASEKIYRLYPEDKEAAIFYALALRAAADPSDKTFAKQRKAGDILNSLFPDEPNHPGIAHYLIHTYDYPELAELALPAARKYASIASSSAHALHMPSHIFTRLGLWQESANSNISSMDAAKCYAEKTGIDGHWDEELHGLDYLVYAYLQQGDDEKAREQLNYLKTVKKVFPENFKIAYTFASVPTRFALERKDWTEATKLQPEPVEFPWDQFLWEQAIVVFGRTLGAIHTERLDLAKEGLEKLKGFHSRLTQSGKVYEADQVDIQIKTSQAWIEFVTGNKATAVSLMNTAAEMEDKTEKHPVTPGEVVPARELLADMYMEMKEYDKAFAAYELDLKRHAGRFNGLFGAALAAERTGNQPKAHAYYTQLVSLANSSGKKRPEVLAAEKYLKQMKI
ncbi:MAG TPA: tetratricopeptide repeat protein [Chryseosolibacter sp.]|nr:tetratricopeptide repeat protein [Chryseosolibacter sp.]